MEHHYLLAPLAQICLKGGGVGVLMSFWWVTHSSSPKMGIRSEKEAHICPFFRMLKKLIGLAVALKEGICMQRHLFGGAERAYAKKWKLSINRLRCENRKRIGETDVGGNENNM